MTTHQRRIIQEIERNPKLKELVLTKSVLPLPHKPSNRIRGVVLGADPSNPKGTTFTHVFGIGDGDRRYFQSIENNLKRVGLSKDDVFVQNVVQNYCTVVTDKNEDWYDFAELWFPQLKRELDEIEGDFPVFVTARKILNFLTSRRESKALWYSSFYREPSFVKADENVLGRKVFPLFRHYYYNLDKQEWNAYRLLIKRHLKQVKE